MNDTELRTQLNYAGLKISEKINKEIYPGLFKKISNYVATYYPMMQQIFSEYDGEEGRSFDRLACNIRSLFLQVFENEKDPNFIYDSIVNEVQKKTGKTRFIAEIIVAFFLCLARIFLPLSHIGTTPRGCGTKKLKYSCLLCGRRKESPGFFFAGMQRRGPGMKKWRFLSLKSSRIKISHSPFFD